MPGFEGQTTPRVHGGPDALGVPRFDFSTNSNACGPCPMALAAVQQANASHYPDASYTALRAQLAEFHGVPAWRIVLAGSASEFIFRMTAWVAQRRLVGHAAQVSLPAAPLVGVPPLAYGDYAQAAQAWGLPISSAQTDAASLGAAQLVWACEPSSPLGGAHGVWPVWLTGLSTAQQGKPPAAQWAPRDGVPALVLDCAYEPLRLGGAPSLSAQQLNRVWQLWTPNKALGLTGVRAAYAIAPDGAQADVAALERLCASWPIGAHGVAMLQSWVQPEVQAWLARSLQTLRDWKARQIAMLQALGWNCLPSEANFFCAIAPAALDLAALRMAGIKLRDATSLGLPGHFRLGVLAPEAQEALALALPR
jgi:histidinol-phosphate aminotransferase